MAPALRWENDYAHKEWCCLIICKIIAPFVGEKTLISHSSIVKLEIVSHCLFHTLQSADIPAFSDLEYQQHLHDEHWTKQETDHLFDLCKRFDLRFVVMQDRWDRESFGNRSVEDLKERYYNICNILTKVRTSLALSYFFTFEILRQIRC